MLAPVPDELVCIALRAMGAACSPRPMKHLLDHVHLILREARAPSPRACARLRCRALRSEELEVITVSTDTSWLSSSATCSGPAPAVTRLSEGSSMRKGSSQRVAVLDFIRSRCPFRVQPEGSWLLPDPGRLRAGWLTQSDFFTKRFRACRIGCRSSWRPSGARRAKTPAKLTGEMSLVGKIAIRCFIISSS